MLCPLYKVIPAIEQDAMIGVHISHSLMPPQLHKQFPAQVGQYSVGLQSYANISGSGLYTQDVPQISHDHIAPGMVSLQ